MTDAHFRSLERMYASAPCNRLIIPTMRIGRGTAEVSFSAQPDFFHSARAVHGSYYFKALDDAAFFAANSLEPQFFVLTVSFTVQILRPITEGMMVATGQVVRAGSQILFAESVLRNGTSEDLAHGSGVFCRSKTPLAEAIGYGEA